jgi:hypothetical protein
LKAASENWVLTDVSRQVWSLHGTKKWELLIGRTWKCKMSGVTDRRLLMKAIAGAALLGMTRANAAKSFTIGYLALLRGEDRMRFMERFMRRLNELGLSMGRTCA